MAVSKSVQRQLTRFVEAFADARKRRANESDTVMYLIKFFEEVLGYDSLQGQITKELAIQNKFCDIALQPEGEPRVLVEAKAAYIAQLSPKHIEQAENYASRSGLTWVVLTNGVEWRLYHLTWGESEGITHELAFSLNLLEEIGTDMEGVWSKLSLLAPQAITSGALEQFWAVRKLLRPASVVRVLFRPEVLGKIQSELNRESAARLDLQDVFNAVRDIVSKDALMEAGELRLRKSRTRSDRTSADAASGRGSSVTARVSFDVQRVGGGVRVTVKGRPETEEVIPMADLDRSVSDAAYAYTDKHIGPREVVGNKGGSLYNRIRAALR